MPDCSSCRHQVLRKTGTGEPTPLCGHPRILSALHIGPHVGVGPSGLLMHVAPKLCMKHGLYEPGEIG